MPGQHRRVARQRPPRRRARLREGERVGGEAPSRLGEVGALVAVRRQVVGARRVQRDQEDVRRPRRAAAPRSRRGSRAAPSTSGLPSTAQRDRRGGDLERRARTPRRRITNPSSQSTSDRERAAAARSATGRREPAQRAPRAWRRARSRAPSTAAAPSSAACTNARTPPPVAPRRARRQPPTARRAATSDVDRLGAHARRLVDAHAARRPRAMREPERDAAARHDRAERRAPPQPPTPRSSAAIVPQRWRRDDAARGPVAARPRPANHEPASERPSRAARAARRPVACPCAGRSLALPEPVDHVELRAAARRSAWRSRCRCRAGPRT